MSAPTAAWSGPALVGALCRSGWGDELDGRAGQGLRSVLRALVDLTPHDSAQGTVTAAQIADAAGLSVRWTRHLLHQLEAAGLIIWRRGWLEAGKPRAGWMRLCKTAIADLVRKLRGSSRMSDRRAARTEQLRERVSKLRRPTIRTQRPHNPLSRRAELSSPLSPSRGEIPNAGPRGVPVSAEGVDPMPECIHHNPYGPSACPDCRPLLVGKYAGLGESVLYSRDEPVDAARASSWAARAREAIHARRGVQAQQEGLPL